MPRLLLTVKTITPLLMYGADNKSYKNKKPQPELRAPSVRGILRYWLRAVLGQQYQLTDKLYEAESRILGSTSQGSQISVRILSKNSLVENDNLLVMPKQVRDKSGNIRDMKHAGYEAENQFVVKLSTHHLASVELLEDLFTGDFLKAVYLMTHLGGLGKRARRGSGNLRVLKAELKTEKKAQDVKAELGEGLSLDHFASDRGTLKTYLDGITKAIGSGVVIGHRPSFPIFAHDTVTVLLGKKTWNDYQDAFDELWKVSGPYHRTGDVFGKVKDKERRASAIHMRVSETKAGYVPLMTILYSGKESKKESKKEWQKMKDFINHTTSNGFDAIYGDWSSW